jgi:hypothetical protein
MILPGKSISLCLDDLKKVSKKSLTHKTDVSLDRVKSEQSLAFNAEEGPIETYCRKIPKDSLERKNQLKKFSGGKEAKPFHSSETFVHQSKECDHTLNQTWK